MILLLASLLWCIPDADAAQKQPAFVTASFVGKNRLFLEDLTGEEIRIYENGQPRKVEYLQSGEVPVVFGFLFDRAFLPQPYDEPRYDRSQIPSSMGAMNVAHQVIDQGLGAQTGWVAVYDKDLRTVVDFTSDSGRLKDAIQAMRGERTIEDSSLYAALFQAVRKVADRNEKRRVLIVFLESIDRETSGKLKPLKNLLAASNVELFVAGFGSKAGALALQNEAALRDLGSVTAGGVYFTSMEGLEGLGRRIVGQIRTFYTIGFQSESKDGQPPSLKIECTRPGVKVSAHPVTPILQ